MFVESMAGALDSAARNPSSVRRFAAASLAVALVAGAWGVRAQAQAGVEGRVSNPAADLFTRIVPDDCRAPAPSDFSELRQAADLFHRRGQTSEEARTLMLLGILDQEVGQYAASISWLRKASTAATAARDPDAASRAQALIGLAMKESNDWRSGLQAVKNALRMAREPSTRGFALTVQAEIDYASGQGNPEGELADALRLSLQAGDLKTQAIILNDQADLFGEKADDAQKKIDRFNKTLEFEQHIQDCREQSATLGSWGEVEIDAGHARSGLEDYQQALKLDQQTGNQAWEAVAWHNLGFFYQEMGDLDAALDDLTRSLKLEKDLKESREEGATMSAIAGIYRDQGKPAKALSAYQAALPVLRTTANAEWQIITLNNMATVEADLHHPVPARAWYLESERKAAAVDPVVPGYSEWGLGELEQADALSHYSRALRLAREYNQADLEGMVNASLMHHFHTHRQPEVAIFFGKRAVDSFQSIRQSMGGLSDAIVSSFLQKKASAYRELAELLIEQGRLPEAQQILDLLKIQQFADYVRQQPNAFAAQLSRAAAEEKLDGAYGQRFQAMIEADAAVQKLQDQPAARRSPDSLRAQAAQKKAEADFSSFLQELYRTLSAPGAQPAAVQPSGAERSLQNLLAADPHTVALYTLLTADAYRVIVISAAGSFVRSAKIPQPVLEQECSHFLDQLSNGNDSSEPATQLYATIFGPVADDLRRLGATTLVWSLDGALRYIPLAALYDATAHQYVIEKYSVVNFSPLGRFLEPKPRLAGTAGLALAVNRVYDDALPRLEYARLEAEAVVADHGDSNSRGVVPGTILVDEEFTREAMEEKIQGQGIVHIASHFVLKPGNDDLSYLLIGGDPKTPPEAHHFSMADFAGDQKLQFQGTHLFTLSACQTGAENKRTDDGVVMESLSELVLDKGAESVLSSLWSVYDPSTELLMADFYKHWAGSNGDLSKVDALRRAELDLLQGRIKPPLNYADPSAPASFADPYYWAPFVLMGNWQ
jgi:CHAT domain-containing protein